MVENKGKDKDSKLYEARTPNFATAQKNSYTQQGK